MKTTKIRPMNKNIIIDWSTKVEEEVTSFGLVIQGAEVREDTATVIAVYDGCEDIKVGDVVIFNKLAGKFVREEMQELLVIPEDEIFAVLE